MSGKLEKQSDVFKLPVPNEGEAVYFDQGKDRQRGLALRVRAAGSRRWTLYYRFVGKQKRAGIGDAAAMTLDEARRAARQHRLTLDRGGDPATEKATKRAAASLLFLATAEDYLAVRAKDMKPRSHVECTRHLRKLWKPLHGIALGAVSRPVLAAHIRSIAEERGPVSANRARATLSAMYGWAIGEGLCDVNPVDGTNKAAEEPARERVLSDAELAAIWKAAPASDYGWIVRLLMLTAQRRDEIGSLRWSEVDLDAKLISLPGARTKNGRPHDVPLSKLATDAIDEIPRRNDRDSVFGAGEGGFSGWSKAKARLDTALKFSKAAPWTLHDLRRSAATGMANLGIQPHVIEAILNHISGHKSGVAGIYNRSTYATEKKAALDVWASHLKVAIAKADGANVVPLAKPKSR
jgi:integrase